MSGGLRSPGAGGSRPAAPGAAAPAGRRHDLTEGERLTRLALDRLRARRFSAPALVEFLDDSLVRARRARSRRPRLVRRSRALGLTGLAAALPFGARPVAWWLGWWAMVDWHLGMVETPAGRPRNLGLADALSLSRLWLAPVARRRPRTGVIVWALVSDAADGPLARRDGATRFGRDVDSAADATLFHALLRGLVDERRLGPAVLAAENARLVMAAAVGVRGYFGASARPATPQERAVAAALGAAGTLLAARGLRRPAEALVTASVGARTLLGLRGLRAGPR